MRVWLSVLTLFLLPGFQGCTEDQTAVMREVTGGSKTSSEQEQRADIESAYAGCIRALKDDEDLKEQLPEDYFRNAKMACATARDACLKDPHKSLCESFIEEYFDEGK